MSGCAKVTGVAAMAAETPKGLIPLLLRKSGDGFAF